MKKFENGGGDAKPAAASQTEAHTSASDAQLEAMKKETAELNARLKGLIETAEQNNKKQAEKQAADDKKAEEKKVEEKKEEKKKAEEKKAEQAAKPAAPAKPAVSGDAADKAERITDEVEAKIKELVESDAHVLAEALAGVIGKHKISKEQAKAEGFDQKMAKMILAAKTAQKDGKRIKDCADFKSASDALEDAIGAFLNKK